MLKKLITTAALIVVAGAVQAKQEFTGSSTVKCHDRKGALTLKLDAGDKTFKSYRQGSGWKSWGATNISSQKKGHIAFLVPILYLQFHVTDNNNGQASVSVYDRNSETYQVMDCKILLNDIKLVKKPVTKKPVYKPAPKKPVYKPKPKTFSPSNEYQIKNALDQIGVHVIYKHCDIYKQGWHAIYYRSHNEMVICKNSHISTSHLLKHETIHVLQDCKVGFHNSNDTPLMSISKIKGYLDYSTKRWVDDAYDYEDRHYEYEAEGFARGDWKWKNTTNMVQELKRMC